MSATDNLPDEVTLAVPRAYRDYLLHRRTVKYSVLLVIYSLLLYSYYYQWRHGRVGIDFLPHLILSVVSASVLLTAVRLYKGWQYTVDGTSIKLVLWEWQNILWEWHELQWRQDVVITVEQDEWRGLPALRIKVRMKNKKTPQDLWMVYTHQDQETVQNVILPLIEKYRKQYRHEYWAEQCRQEKQTS